MTNKEKYSEILEKYFNKIENCIKDTTQDSMETINFCEEFIRPTVLKKDSCIGMNCNLCNLYFDKWLRQECDESFESCQKDELIKVRLRPEDPWALRYFSHYDEHTKKIHTYIQGFNSKNNSGRHTAKWNYGEYLTPNDVMELSDKIN